MWIFDSADRDVRLPRRSGAVGVLWGRFGLFAAGWARVCAGVGLMLFGVRRRLVVRGVGVAVAVLASVVVPAGAASAAAGRLSAPGGLSAVSVEGGVLLSWDAPEAEAGGGEVSGYRVLRRRPEQGARSLSVLVSDTGSVETSYLDESAAVEGELFVYRVVALAGGVAGKRSGRARVRYAAPEPAPVVQAAPDPEPEARAGAEAEAGAGAEPGAVEVVLSGVLSVGFDGSVVPAMSGFSAWARRGSLSPRSFTVDGSAVRVLVLVEHAGGMFLAMDQAMGTDFVLDVGGREFVGSDSLVPALAVRGAYWWPSGGLSWSDGDTVDVELRAAADAVPIGVRDAAPVWAYFDRVPDAHDGAGEFGVRLRFGEDVDTDAAALRDSVLAVSGGSVTAVEAAAGSTSGWSVTVQPDGAGDVTVSVGGALGCADAAAVCTTDGRTLPAGIAVSVAGPAAPAPPQLSNLVLDAVAPAPLTSEQTRSETQALPAVSEATVAVTPKEAGSTGEVFAASGLTLNPAFSPDETLYIAQTPAGVTEVTVTAAAVRQDTAVEIAPQDADVTTEGHQVALVADGDTAISVTTTSADGTETLQYWVTVSPPFDLSSVAAGIDPQLSKLGTLSFNGLASLSFESDQARYELAAPSGVTETIVIASPLFAGAGVELLVVRSDDPTLSIDRTVAAGPIVASNIALSATGDTLVMLRVTSPDGQHQSLYVVLIHRDSQPQANNPSDSQLARFVRDNQPQADNPSDSQLARFGGSSAASLESQIAPRTSVPAAGDATLSDLTLTGATLSPSFSSATTSYTAEATADTDQVTLSVTTADAAASTAISPADADPNTAGWQVALTTPGVGGAPSKTTISIVVGSADNASLNVYVVDVFRAAPESAPTAGQGNYVPQLVELSVNGLGVTAPGHSLIPSFSPGVYEYYVPGRSDTAEYEMNIRASTHPENDLHVSVEGAGTSVIRRWTYYHLDRSLGDGVFTGPTDDEVVARGKSILAGLSEGLNLVYVDVNLLIGTVQTYTLRIVVGPKSEDAELRSLDVRVGESSEDDLPLSPEFSSDKRFYTIKSARSRPTVFWPCMHPSPAIQLR